MLSGHFCLWYSWHDQRNGSGIPVLPWIPPFPPKRTWDHSGLRMVKEYKDQEHLHNCVALLRYSWCPFVMAHYVKLEYWTRYTLLLHDCGWTSVAILEEVQHLCLVDHYYIMCAFSPDIKYPHGQWMVHFRVHLKSCDFSEVSGALIVGLLQLR